MNILRIVDIDLDQFVIDLHFFNGLQPIKKILKRYLELSKLHPNMYCDIVK